MKKHSLISMLVLSVSIIFSPAFSFAEDPVQSAEESVVTENEEVTEFSYGTVKSTSEDQLVVTEYDYDNDKDIEVTYSIPADATLEGVDKLTEIVAGDAVDIDYVVRGGQRMVSMISVDKGTDQLDEEIPVEDAESILAQYSDAVPPQ